MGYVMVEAERRTQAEGSPPFGFLLKTWRQRRKLSQLDLALEAGVSQRHLSFLESGRSRPSRSMALHLAAALDLPLRERNHLLLQAGFAAAYDERSLSSADMTAVRQALELTLRHHEPFPAIVIDRAWNLVLANQATFRFLALFGPQEAIWARVDPSGRRNVMRLSFHPAGLQAFLRNWREAAGQALNRLQRETAADPGHLALRELFEDLLRMPGVPVDWRARVWDTVPPPIVPLELDLQGRTLRLFSMLSTFGTALDVTAEELRVETFFPADDASDRFLRDLAGASAIIPGATDPAAAGPCIPGS